MKVTQSLVDHIVARAQNSSMGLGNPEKPNAYNLVIYAQPSLESLALLLVSAHFDKYDIASIVTAAFEELTKELRADLTEAEQDNDKLHEENNAIRKNLERMTERAEKAKGALEEIEEMAEDNMDINNHGGPDALMRIYQVSYAALCAVRKPT